MKEQDSGWRQMAVSMGTDFSKGPVAIGRGVMVLN